MSLQNNSPEYSSENPIAKRTDSNKKEKASATDVAKYATDPSLLFFTDRHTSSPIYSENPPTATGNTTGNHKDSPKEAVIKAMKTTASIPSNIYKNESKSNIAD